MGFELTIAVKRDPADGSAPGRAPSALRESCASIVLTGILDEAAARAVLQTISEIAAKSAGSILVRMEDVRADDFVCLQGFAKELMSFRARAIHVQVAVKDPALHTSLAMLPDARDWLLRLGDIDPGVPRRAVHLDGPAHATGRAALPAAPE